MISELREEGLWDSLVSQAELVSDSSTVEQPSSATIEPSHSTEEHAVTEDSSPTEKTITEELASLSLEPGKDDFQTINTLEQKKYIQLDIEFSSNQNEGMTCCVVCSIRNSEQDFQVLGHGVSKVQSDIVQQSIFAYTDQQPQTARRERGSFHPVSFQATRDRNVGRFFTTEPYQTYRE